jgi:hypothetical protein
MDVALGIVMLQRCVGENSTSNSSSCGIARTVAALARLDFVAILVQVFFAFDGEPAG